MIATPTMSLFDAPPLPAPAPAGRMIGRGIPLRWCQRQDVDALFHAVGAGHRRLCNVAATGYGKGAVIAETAGRCLREGGKVLVTVDRANLVYQLADEIERHLITEVGRIADGECVGMTRDIVVATVQSMYTPDATGRPLFEYPAFKDVRWVIPDEGHKFFADKFRSVLDYFVDERDARALAFTATPAASNGARWKSFFDWTPTAEGPCMRTVGWCVRNGYLVPPRQAFVSVNLDLAAIYNKLSDVEGDDEGDEAEDPDSVLVEILKRRSERDALAFAKGVVKVIGAHRSIVFAPPRRPQTKPDDAPCKLLAAWLQGAGMSSEAVWGGRADVSDVLMAFKRGTPQSLCNVNLLCEGFDAPTVSGVFICRLIKKWRLIQQMVGRALRPHPSTIDLLNQNDGDGPDAAERRCAVLANSVKPYALVADLAGRDGKLLRASALDVLYANEGEDLRAVAGEIVLGQGGGAESEQGDELLEEARSELLKRQHASLEALARARGMSGELPADVSVSYDGESPADELPSLPIPKAAPSVGELARFVAIATQYDAETAMKIAEGCTKNKLRGMTAGMEKRLAKIGGKPDWKRAREAYPEWNRAKAQATVDKANVPAGPLPSGLKSEQFGLLRKYGVPEKTISTFNPQVADTVIRQCIDRHKAKLCTWLQASALKQAGYPQNEIRGMSQRRAHDIIDGIKAKQKREANS